MTHSEQASSLSNWNMFNQIKVNIMCTWDCRMQQLPWQLLMQMLQPPRSRYLFQICCPWDHLYRI